MFLIAGKRFIAPFLYLVFLITITISKALSQEKSGEILQQIEKKQIIPEGTPELSIMKEPYLE